jgi:hypothetical protein
MNSQKAFLSELKKPAHHQSNGLAELVDQRLAMYMVISKPKRISVAAGVCHFIVSLLEVTGSRHASLFIPLGTLQSLLPRGLVQYP